jgi:amidase
MSDIGAFDAVNPKLNAVICPLYERARAEARVRTEKGAQPEERFPGVPYLLKDLLTDMRGAPLADGSRFVHGYVSQVDSELVQRSRASGLVIAARTNTSEFGVLTTAAAPSAFRPPAAACSV